MAAAHTGPGVSLRAPVRNVRQCVAAAYAQACQRGDDASAGVRTHRYRPSRVSRRKKEGEGAAPKGNATAPQSSPPQHLVRCCISGSDVSEAFGSAPCCPPGVLRKQIAKIFFPASLESAFCLPISPRPCVPFCRSARSEDGVGPYRARVSLRAPVRNVRLWKPASAVRFSAGGCVRTLSLRTVSRSPRRSKGAALARFTPADGRRRSSDARGGDGSRHFGEKKEAGPRACVAFGLCETWRGRRFPGANSERELMQNRHCH
jgi:hypothetical protein